jgi:hypothetical protein
MVMTNEKKEPKQRITEEKVKPIISNPKITFNAVLPADKVDIFKALAKPTIPDTIPQSTEQVTPATNQQTPAAPKKQSQINSLSNETKKE